MATRPIPPPPPGWRPTSSFGSPALQHLPGWSNPPVRSGLSGGVIAAIVVAAVALVLVPAVLTGLFLGSLVPAPGVPSPWVALTYGGATHDAAGYHYEIMVESVDPNGSTWGAFSFWFSTAALGDVGIGSNWTLNAVSPGLNYTSGFDPSSHVLRATPTPAIVAGQWLTFSTGSTSLSRGLITFDPNQGTSGPAHFLMQVPIP